jgi:hypothetical protein
MHLLNECSPLAASCARAGPAETAKTATAAIKIRIVRFLSSRFDIRLTSAAPIAPHRRRKTLAKRFKRSGRCLSTVSR